MPQSIDNQYMSADVFRKVQSRKVTLGMLLEGAATQSGLQGQFFDEHKAEYIRSLLYSRRLVVNRAAFWNNPVLVASVTGDDYEAIVALLSAGVLIPYLWKEESFAEVPAFKVLGAGAKAVTRLVQDPSLSEIRCVRLGGSDPAKAKIENDRFTSNFWSALQRPLVMQDTELRLVTTALFDDSKASPRDHRGLAHDLRGVAKFVQRHRPLREQLYRKYVTHSAPTESRYRTSARTFELKKWFDAVYTANLPATLHARTFTPRGMPTPLDLGLTLTDHGQPDVEVAAGDFNIAGAEIVERAKSLAATRAWNALEHQVTVPVPAPHELSHQDVIEIRSWSSWNAMMDAMELHVEQAFDAAAMKQFWEAYHEFLRQLSAWWLRTKGAEAREEFAVGVSRIWRCGQWFVGLVQLEKQLFPVLPAPHIKLPFDVDGDNAERLLEVVVETGLYLYQKAGLDWRRSQAVRGLQKVQKVERAELVKMYESIRKVIPELPTILVAQRDDDDNTAIEETPS